MQTKRGFLERKRGIDAASARQGDEPVRPGSSRNKNLEPPTAGKRAGLAGGPGAGGRWAAVALAVSALLAAASGAAEPTSHEVIWAHPDGAAVKRFVVFVSSVKGDTGSARRIDVGKPEGHPSGSFAFYSAVVTLETDEFVAVAAVGHDGRLGALSSWSGVRPSRPGQPIVITP